MVGDDHVHAEAAAELRLLNGGDAAVDGDQEADALFPQRLKRGAVKAVALLVPVRDIRVRAQAAAAQIVRHQAGGGDAVHVIVAVDGDRLPGFDGLADPGARDVHPQHEQGIVQKLCPALEQRAGLRGGRDPAQGQHSREQRPVSRIGQFPGNLRPGKGDAPFLRFHISVSSFLSFFISQ